MFLKNTSGQFVTFTMISVTTGAPVTGITPTCRRCIDGTFAAATGTITEDTGLGFYKMALSQADTNGNNIGYRFLGTGAIDTVLNIVTTSLNPYDAVRFGMTALPNANAEAAGGLFTRGTGAGQINQDANGRVNANNVAFGGTAGTYSAGIPEVKVNNIAANAITAAAIATNAIDADALAADAVTEIQSGLASSAQATDITNKIGSPGTTLANDIASGDSNTQAAIAGVQNDTNDIQDRLPAALVGGRIDASVGAMASAVVTAAAIATDAIGAAEIAAGAANKIADHIIRRTMVNARASSDGDAVNSRSMLGMLSLHRNKKDVSGSNLVVKTEDDSTTFYTDALSTDAAAVPIVGVDPA